MGFDREGETQGRKEQSGCEEHTYTHYQCQLKGKTEKGTREKNNREKELKDEQPEKGI